YTRLFRSRIRPPGSPAAPAKATTPASRPWWTNAPKPKKTATSPAPTPSATSWQPKALPSKTRPRESAGFASAVEVWHNPCPPGSTKPGTTAAVDGPGGAALGGTVCAKDGADKPQG